MERDAKYLRVGAFVLAAIAMAVFFVLWYTGSRDQREYQRYEIYFQGSVSGLNEGSVVRYLGVDVGRLKAIALDPRTADRVRVVADIDTQAPISKQTVASLGLQGVTGLLFVDLEQDPGDKPLMPEVPSLKYPVIRSVQSDFDLLISSMPELFSKAAIAADRVTKLLSDENIAAANSMVGNVVAASDELPGLMRDARSLIADLKRSAGEFERTAASVRRVTDNAGPDVEAALVSVREVAASLAATSRRLETFIADNQANVSRFTGQGLIELEQLIRDGRQAAGEIRQLTQSLRENPSQLIYENKPTGVEIAR